MTTFLSPIHSPLPTTIDERIEQAINSDETCRLEDRSEKIAQNPRDSSHSQSLRTVTNRFNSSDPVSCESDSIYNAENVLSDDLQWLSAISSYSDLSLPSTSLTPPPLLDLTTRSDPELFASHSRWPQTPLEPIIERRSQSEARKSISIPRLHSSPGRHSKIVHPKRSIHSMRLPSSHHRATCLNQNQDKSHNRSFSLNDLDCFPRSDTKQALSQYHQYSSSSSTDVLRAISLCPSFPFEPIYSPPHRVPTPTGIAPFRTREAQEYRLMPSSHPNRATALLYRLLRRNYDENDDRFAALSSPLSPPTSPRPQNVPFSPPIAILKRVLGVSRLVESPPRQDPSPRVALPQGIRIASQPGALVQAEDGTFVRGRWGMRASGHGVGQRTFDMHPLVRVAGLQSIDDVVTQIDKACDTAEEENHHGQMHGACNSATTSADMTDVVLSSPIIPGTCHGNNSPASAMLPDGPIFLSEPHRYGVTFLENSDACDNFAGFRRYVEQGEREQVRQVLANKKQEESACEKCWQGFWFFCCGSAVGRGHRCGAEI